MECDICHANIATFHLTEIVDGKIRKLHICEPCAEKNGVNLQEPNSIPEILLELNNQVVLQADADRDKRCPTCHMRWSDYRKTSRLGCPACYEAFTSDLAPMLKSIQKGTCHSGKTPGALGAAAVEAVADSAELKRLLLAAVKSESFEEAARLRDEIRRIEAAAH